MKTNIWRNCARCQVKAFKIYDPEGYKLCAECVERFLDHVRDILHRMPSISDGNNGIRLKELQRYIRKYYIPMWKHLATKRSDEE